MKFTVDRPALLDLLSLAQGAAASSARTAKPTLACVLLTADAPMLHVAATDLEVSLRASTPRVEVTRPGSVAVPLDRLLPIVRDHADPTLALSADPEEPNVLWIHAKDAKFKLHGYSWQDCPTHPAQPIARSLEVAAGVLSRLLRQTTFACARENSRYAINGVLVGVPAKTPKTLNLIATDGHRLAIAYGPCEPAPGAGGMAMAILSLRFAALLGKLLGRAESADSPASLTIADNHAFASLDNVAVSSTLVDGSFPAYQDVIPRDCDRRAEADPKALAQALKRAALLTSEETKGVRLAFAPAPRAGHTLTMTSRAEEMGEAEIALPLAGYAGAPLEIGVNPAYLLDALRACEDQSVSLEAKAPNKPMVLKANGFAYVVMPINLAKD